MACDSLKSEISLKNFAHVDPDLSELISDYLQNCHKDIKAIDAALKDANLVRIGIPDLQ